MENEYAYTIEWLCRDCNHAFGADAIDDAYTLKEIIEDNLLEQIVDCPKCYLDRHVVLFSVDLV